MRTRVTNGSFFSGTNERHDNESVLYLLDSEWKNKSLKYNKREKK